MTLTGLLLLPASGEAGTRGIDLAKPYKGIELVGAHKVSGGGDVNGDGVRDVVVARGQFGQEPTNGRTYVVFGENRMEDLDLEILATRAS